ncbi:amidohydrolase family protein [Arthrobacter sp. 35W]|uniref:amidohydrolase family protein n=1 Tax=Arthrobacter sp. 35W TaxID=1132441 RepID=UPI0004112CBB|nr:amidohydrolase family protein [Arthrobacter sp. 35W]
MTSVFENTFVLRSAALSDGATADVYLKNGLIERVVPLAGAGVHAAGGPDAGVSAVELDLAGYLLLPSPVEPHAHLDKALLGSRVTNATGDLAGAITAIIEAYPSMTGDDIGRRGLKALGEALAHGYTAVRTHVDCREEIGTAGVRALVELRGRLAGLADLQIVALAGGVGGRDGAANRAVLAESLALGADLVGGVPSLEDDPTASLAELFAMAADHGRGIDVHIDETTDGGTFVLQQLAERVLASGFAGPVTASHCVSLGMQEPEVARKTARLIAEAGISVVALPQTNLFLQGRETTTRKPRGLTAVEDLLSAGATVAAGGDNWRDPFNPMGRIDAMETASLLVSAGHLLVGTAYECVSTHARTAMGLPEVRMAPGFPADLMAIRASSLEEAVAAGAPARIVFKGGRMVARTEVATTLDPLFG